MSFDSLPDQLPITAYPDVAFDIAPEAPPQPYPITGDAAANETYNSAATPPYADLQTLPTPFTGEPLPDADESASKVPFGLGAVSIPHFADAEPAGDKRVTAEAEPEATPAASGDAPGNRPPNKPPTPGGETDSGDPDDQTGGSEQPDDEITAAPPAGSTDVQFVPPEQPALADGEDGEDVDIPQQRMWADGELLPAMGAAIRALDPEAIDTALTGKTQQELLKMFTETDGSISIQDISNARGISEASASLAVRRVTEALYRAAPPDVRAALPQPTGKVKHFSDPENMHTGDRANLLRTQSGYTVVQLADTLGVSKSTLEKFFAGRTQSSPDLAHRVFAALGAAPDRVESEVLAYQLEQEENASRGPNKAGQE